MCKYAITLKNYNFKQKLLGSLLGSTGFSWYTDKNSGKQNIFLLMSFYRQIRCELLRTDGNT